MSLTTSVTTAARGSKLAFTLFGGGSGFEAHPARAEARAEAAKTNTEFLTGISFDLPQTRRMLVGWAAGPCYHRYVLI